MIYLTNRLGSKPGTPGGPKGSKRAPGGTPLLQYIFPLLVSGGKRKEKKIQ